MDNGVIRGVKLFSLPLIGEHSSFPIVLVAHHAAIPVLAGDLAPFPIKGIPVAVSRRVAEYAHMAVVIDPAELDVIGDVTPDQVSSNGAPGRAFRPQRAGVQTLNRRVADFVFLESPV